MLDRRGGCDHGSKLVGGNSGGCCVSSCKLWCRKFGLDANTVDFIGHSLALHRDDRFLSEPALDFVKRVKVCRTS